MPGEPLRANEPRCQYFPELHLSRQQRKRLGRNFSHWKAAADISAGCANGGFCSFQLMHVCRGITCCGENWIFSEPRDAAFVGSHKHKTLFVQTFLICVRLKRVLIPFGEMRKKLKLLMLADEFLYLLASYI